MEKLWSRIIFYVNEEVLKIQDVKMMDQTARSAGRLIAEDQSN